MKKRSRVILAVFLAVLMSVPLIAFANPTEDVAHGQAPNDYTMSCTESCCFDIGFDLMMSCLEVCCLDVDFDFDYIQLLSFLETEHDVFLDFGSGATHIIVYLDYYTNQGMSHEEVMQMYADEFLSKALLQADVPYVEVAQVAPRGIQCCFAGTVLVENSIILHQRNVQGGVCIGILIIVSTICRNCNTIHRQRSYEHPPCVPGWC